MTSQTQLVTCRTMLQHVTDKLVNGIIWKKYINTLYIVGWHVFIIFRVCYGIQYIHRAIAQSRFRNNWKREAWSSLICASCLSRFVGKDRMRECDSVKAGISNVDMCMFTVFQSNHKINHRFTDAVMGVCMYAYHQVSNRLYTARWNICKKVKCSPCI